MTQLGVTVYLNTPQIWLRVIGLEGKLWVREIKAREAGVNLKLDHLFIIIERKFWIY
jgi:hypothetical protein